MASRYKITPESRIALYGYNIYTRKQIQWLTSWGCTEIYVIDRNADKIGKIEKFDKNESDKIDRKERKTEKISSPLKGEVIALSDVQDEAFSSGALGLGAAVAPKEGVLYAPADGTDSVFFPTGHAIGMTTDDGVELLIHVGMDTVQLEGKGFRPFAKEGDRVTKGQKLLEFDMELICKEGYSLVTPVLITNTDEFSDI